MEEFWYEGVRYAGGIQDQKRVSSSILHHRDRYRRQNASVDGKPELARVNESLRMALRQGVFQVTTRWPDLACCMLQAASSLRPGRLTGDYIAMSTAEGRVTRAVPPYFNGLLINLP